MNEAHTTRVTSIEYPSEYFTTVTNWDRWDQAAAKILRWINDNTELVERRCVGARIYFKTEAELIWFNLVFGNDL